jgi:uncharacterized protein (TIGR03067 family)
MIKYTVWIAAAVFLIAADAKEEAAKQLAALEGTWTAVSAQRNGKPAEEVKGCQLTFKGEHFTITARGKTVFEGTVKLNHSQSPKAIDFLHMKGKYTEDGDVWLGIYALDGDTFLLCDNGADVKQARPKEFTGEQPGCVLAVFKKDKP